MKPPDNKKEGTFEFEFAIPVWGNTFTKPVPPPAVDVDALRRQLEQLNAELQEIRKRIDAEKK